MALKGLKVLEFAGLAPVPFCGMVLSDFGASVLRIDKLSTDLQMDFIGHGKQSIALNLKSDKGREIIQKLARKSDVLIDPFRKGVMERLGLGPDNLMKDNPKLIYARLTGYGQSGSFSPNAGHDINYLALSGLLSLFGRKGENPLFPVNLAADFGGGGLNCTLGILLALYERQKSGLGQIVDCSMVEGTAYLGSWLFRSKNNSLVWGKKRGENLLDSGAHFYETYETKDGNFVSVGAIEPQFYQELLNGLGLTDEEAPQYGDFSQLKQLLADKFRQKTRREWCEIFDKTDACVAPVLSLEEAAEHPHNKERGSFLKVGDDIVPKPAPVLSRTPGVSCGTLASPEKGEHTKKILIEELDLSEREINALLEEGIISYKSKI